MKKLFPKLLFAFLLSSLIFGPTFKGLRVFAQTTHNITLTWTAPTTGGAPTSYIVLRGTASGAESPLAGATVAAPTTTYVDTTGTGGVTYFYEVESVNSAGTSGPSNEASATFLLLPPGAPGALKAASN